jgi:hypothetical protein
MNSLPPEVLWEIIKILCGFMVALMGIGMSVFVFFHKGILRRLDSIDGDLKPIITKIAVQEQKIVAQAQNMDSFHDRLNEHEKRISKLEYKKHE